MNYYIFKDRIGEWRWHLKASNGLKIAASGEGYKNKQDCVYAISLVKASADAPVKELSAANV